MNVCWHLRKQFSSNSLITPATLNLQKGRLRSASNSRQVQQQGLNIRQGIYIPKRVELSWKGYTQMTLKQ